MTSPRPPRLRDTRTFVDRIRQDRTNLGQLGVGFMGGRFPPLRPLGAPALLGDIEDDSADGGAPLEILQFINDDTLAWSGIGDLIIGLSHIPWSDSLQMKLNGHELEPSDWTRDSSLNTVKIPAQPWWTPALAAGVEIRGTAYYAYYEADDAVDDGGGGSLLAFQSAGWKFKQIARTDATDYSSPTFDDSAWTTATAAFGDGGDMADDSGGPHTTLWQKSTRMWGRRTLTGLEPGADITATIRADNSLVMWLDGVQVYSGTPNGSEHVAVIAGSAVTDSSLVLACQVTDESASDGCYFDLELV